MVSLFNVTHLSVHTVMTLQCFIFIYLANYNGEDVCTLIGHLYVFFGDYSKTLSIFFEKLNQAFAFLLSFKILLCISNTSPLSDIRFVFFIV